MKRNTPVSLRRPLTALGAATLMAAGCAASTPADFALRAVCDSVSYASLYPAEREIRNVIENTHIVDMGHPADASHARADSMRNLITRFYVDQFRHFQDPRSPYFMFLSKDANVAMGIGGTVRMRGWYDWGGSLPANGFCPYLIQIPSDPASRRRLAATPSGSALFFTVIGRSGLIGDYMAYIEANFNGYNGLGFQLKKAYATVGDWTVGYAPSTFSDPAAQPPTIDGAGPNGMVSHSTILVRWLHDFRKGWSMAASFEFPETAVSTTPELTSKTTQYIPDVSVMGQYSWDGGLSHIRAAALVRGIAYRDLVAARNRTVAGWGAHISGMFQVARPLTLYGMVAAGEGVGSYMGDLAIGQYDLVARTGHAGELYAPFSLGATAGAKYNFTDRIFAGLALGGLRYYPESNPDNSEYKYGLYGSLSLFWDITPRLRVGGEYLLGKRANFNTDHASANRVDALFMLSF